MADRRRLPPRDTCTLESCGHLCDSTAGHDGQTVFFREYEHEGMYESYATAEDCDCTHHLHVGGSTCDSMACPQCADDAYWDWYDSEEARAKEIRAGIV